MTNIIYQKESTTYIVKDNEQVVTLNQLTYLPLSSYPFTKQSQQNPPNSLRKLAESICMSPTNLEDMRQSRNRAGPECRCQVQGIRCQDPGVT